MVLSVEFGRIWDSTLGPECVKLEVGPLHRESKNESSNRNLRSILVSLGFQVSSDSDVRV